jgi:uroporphyrinogen-III decarboxylase
MTDAQWDVLLAVLGGRRVEPLPVGLIVDCPWLPGFAGTTVLDYLTDDRRWLEANLAAVRRFPDVMLLPGFWAEYGMCTEPAAFGARPVWPEDDFPFARRCLFDYAGIARLEKPDCRTDGLCPFVLKRLARCRGEIEGAGHRVRFATSRGPWNIATYLLGHTEALAGVKLEPAAIHRLLDVVTEFVCDWLRAQAERFDSIDGILVLDDLIGFLGEKDFGEFVVPYFRRIAAAADVRVKALHNDCRGLITARRLTEMGFNLFNFSFEHSLAEMRRLAGEEVVLLGNVPPRDVLARGTPEDVRRAVAESLAGFPDRRRLVLSCGGGTPPGVPAENIDALRAAAASPP